MKLPLSEIEVFNQNHPKVIPAHYRGHATEFMQALGSTLERKPETVKGWRVEIKAFAETLEKLPEASRIDRILQLAAEVNADDELAEIAARRIEARKRLDEAEAELGNLDLAPMQLANQRVAKAREQAERNDLHRFWSSNWEAIEEASLAEVRKLAPMAEKDARKKAWLKHHIETVYRARLMRELAPAELKQSSV